MAPRLKKIAFMARKLFKDLTRDSEIYSLTDDLHSLQLGEYYFIMDEKELLAGHSQDFHFDEDGIPIIPSYIDVAEPRMIYYPISIGQWGLAVYHTWLQTRSAEDKVRFLKIVDWFYDNSIEDEKGIYWLTDVPKPEYRIYQPWPSAFAQSRGISILLRGWQITRLHKYLDAAKEAIKIFEIPAAEGGVTTFTDVGPFYEEYPAPFPTMVLDGFFFSLCGLYDLVRVLRFPKAKELFDAGVRSAKAWLPHYDLGWWVRYNYCREPFYPDPDPATIGYLRLIVTQLRLFHKLTGDIEFSQWADRFKSYDRPRNILRMYAVKYRALKQLNRL